MAAEFYAFIGLAGLALGCFIWGIAGFWRDAHGAQPSRVHLRIQSAGRRRAHEADSPTPASTRDWLARGRFASLGMLGAGALRRLLAESGSIGRPLDFLTWSFMSAILAGAAGLIAGLPKLAVIVAVAGVSIAPLGYIFWMRHRRMGMIEMQIPEALDLMSRAMQAGRSLSSALRLVGLEGPAPIAGEFRATFDEINFGVAEDVALGNLAGRTRIGDLRYFVVAVLIQREAGGNLADLLNSISALVRERIALRGNVRVLSAEGRLSAWIIGLLPFVIAAVIAIINPGFLKILWTDPAGISMLQAAMGLLVLGVIWMWRLVSIRM